ncbi:hypothetical protein [Cohnella nanjingensis]|uniref:Uncharacterized protein n=1 Tax=Cohnella nanjingensis TaxID=1387779 RepID=A0A7X0RWZ0_9BACL|nr:hypothetical protein [Cohnella nanjingensis]MBB6675198.1 hypothetical protein [Cohnella nanjingensis]
MTTNRMQGVIRLHMKDKMNWLVTPWIVVLCSFAVNLVISQFMEADLYTGGVASLYIYMLVIGIVTLTHTFPFAIGFNVRRKDYFWGTLVAAGGASLYSAVILTLLSYVEYDLTDGWGSGLNFFHLPYLSDGSLFVQLVVSFLLILNLFYTGFFITGIFKRFGRAGLFTFAIALLILGTVFSFIMTQQEWWVNVIDWFNAHTMFEFTLWTLPVTVVFMLLSYAMLRRATA